ncbi:MAG: hypothetical protein WCD76_09900 [Pyrinomonadaceae bacterium]
MNTTDATEGSGKDNNSLLAWRVDSQTFEDSLIKFLRISDSVSIVVLLDEINRDALTLLTSEDEDVHEQLRTMLNRFACIGVAALRFHAYLLFDSWLKTAFSIYMAGFTEDGRMRSTRVSPHNLSSPHLWLEITRRVAVVGGYAVRQGCWNAVRQLALQITEDRYSSSHGENQYWLRHADKEAANASLFNSADAQNPRVSSLVGAALQIVNSDSSLRPELASDDYRLLKSHLEFDLLAALIVCADADEFDNSYVYPSFTYWDMHRVEPLLSKLLTNERMKDELFQRKVEDMFLARTLRQIAEAADRRSSVWSRWSGRAITKFLEAHPDSDSKK